MKLDKTLSPNKIANSINIFRQKRYYNNMPFKKEKKTNIK